MARKAKAKKVETSTSQKLVGFFKKNFQLQLKGWVVGNGIEGILGLVLGLSYFGLLDLRFMQVSH